MLYRCDQLWPELVEFGRRHKEQAEPGNNNVIGRRLKVLKTGANELDRRSLGHPLPHVVQCFLFRIDSRDLESLIQKVKYPVPDATAQFESPTLIGQVSIELREQRVQRLLERRLVVA